MELQGLRTFRQGSNEVYLLRHDGRDLLVKRYRGKGRDERCHYERATLKLWAECGFPVPQVWDLEIPNPGAGPCLVMDYLGQLTLQEWLHRDPARPDAKLDFLSRIFRENHRRHRLAIERQDPRLIHADPNSSNILRVDDRFHFIDFERPPGIPDPAEAAAVEIGKFCRWTIRDFGRARIEPVLERLVDAYAGEGELLRRFIDRTCRRPFQWLHRWRDRRWRARHPEDVTKYDLADALDRLLR